VVASALLVCLPAFAADLAVSDADGAITFHNVASVAAFDGRARTFSGRLDPAARTGELVVAAASLTTDLAPRDVRLTHTCLETERFPEIRFTLADVQEAEAARAAGSFAGGVGSGMVTLQGRLTIRDTTLDVEIPAIYAWEGANLHLKGKYDMEWTAFRIPDPSILVSRLSPQMSVAFDVVARPR
jgi:polyisoprenoid-binding protein YceI